MKVVREIVVRLFLFIAIGHMVVPVLTIPYDDAKETLFQDEVRALFFLLWAGFSVLPRSCRCGNSGQKWKPNDKGIKCHRELAPVLDLDSEDEDGNPTWKRRFCQKSATWRVLNSFVYALPATLKPLSFVSILYWFSEGATLKTIRAQSQCSEKIVNPMVEAIQKVMRWCRMQILSLIAFLVIFV
jgi:hypothetical protein